MVKSDQSGRDVLRVTCLWTNEFFEASAECAQVAPHVTKLL